MRISSLALDMSPDSMPLPSALTSSCLAGKAVRDFGMIRDGDRVLLGLSGGKDSLSLLHALVRMQRTTPTRFELGAVTMNPQFPGFDPSPLIPYLKTLGIPYFFESQPLLELAQATKPTSICSWCSRMKRKCAAVEMRGAVTRRVLLARLYLGCKELLWVMSVCAVV